MKKFLYKLLKSNRGLYDFVFEEVIKDRELETVRKVIGSKHVLYKEQITDKNIDISNCLLMNVRIEGCKIQNITNNKMYECSISNNMLCEVDGIKVNK